ncbi:hypothetical protein [Methylovulum psychrotolerans]|uniref:Uncharacterized protein n=1 Tax=Methylovulum psychrotolerans TaxID=1704499 RepID=A0A2S5CSI7_9GAMM|nr:hypothetical protein [Methylovulum psychrotolerans]POZ53748.1 hypothetical protein AADEFJLK_00789 [Methylovulum psychrotolerans]
MKNAKHSLGFLVLMLASTTAWPYGSSSSTKACSKPKFTAFAPADNAEVAAQSHFSFNASKNTYPSTLTVTVKDLPTQLSITPDNDGSFQVSGTLPAALSNTYARIVINAEAQNNCKGSDGWLVKIK